jgi:hypothetical protein
MGKWDHILSKLDLTRYEGRKAPVVMASMIERMVATRSRYEPQALLVFSELGWRGRTFPMSLRWLAALLNCSVSGADGILRRCRADGFLNLVEKGRRPRASTFLLGPAALRGHCVKAKDVARALNLRATYGLFTDPAVRRRADALGVGAPAIDPQSFAEFDRLAGEAESPEQFVQLWYELGEKDAAELDALSAELGRIRKNKQGKPRKPRARRRRP